MNDIDSRLTAALVSVFRPLASIMVRAGIGVRPVIDLVKRCFVDAAINEHGTDDKPASISKASRLTGLTRAEVRRLADKEGVAEMPGKVLGCLPSAVLSLWHTNPLFHDDGGQPARLPIDGGERSFAGLVEIASGNRDFEGTLENLTQIGCIRLTKDQTVEIDSRGRIIRNDLTLLLSSGMGTLASTISKNWNRNYDSRVAGTRVTGVSVDPDRLEQMSAYVQSVDASTLMTVRRMCNERVQRFVHEVDDFLTPLQVLPHEADESVEATNTHRIGIGAYYFEIDAPD